MLKVRFIPGSLSQVFPLCPLPPVCSNADRTDKLSRSSRLYLAVSFVEMAVFNHIMSCFFAMVQNLIIFVGLNTKITIIQYMNNSELKVIADAMLEKKAQNVVSLDLRSIGTAISDHFIVCNADSTPAVVAIADNIEDRMIEKLRRKVVRTQGKENAFWVILDYGDIVVHVFQTPYRAFYRLEDLWADAEKTVYED
jgi:ribosome-associated protein